MVLLEGVLQLQQLRWRKGGADPLGLPERVQQEARRLGTSESVRKEPRMPGRQQPGVEGLRVSGHHEGAPGSHQVSQRGGRWRVVVLERRRRAQVGRWATGQLVMLLLLLVVVVLGDHGGVRGRQRREGGHGHGYAAARHRRRGGGPGRIRRTGGRERVRVRQVVVVVRGGGDVRSPLVDRILADDRLDGEAELGLVGGRCRHHGLRR